MPLCPACLSSIEASAAVCPHCGAAGNDADAAKAPRKKATGFLGFGIVGGIALGVAGTLVWQHLMRLEPVVKVATDTDSRPLPRLEPRDDPSSVPVEEKEARRRCHVLLRSEADPEARLLAVLLRQNQDPLVALATLFLPIEALPLRGALLDAKGSTLDLRVVHADERAGFALLVHEDRAWPPPDLETLRIATQTQNQDLQVLRPDGTFAGSVQIVGRVPATQRFVLGSECPPGAVLLDPANEAVAYVTAGREALSLDQATVWLGRPPSKTLAEAQKQLRGRDPEALLHDAEAALRTAIEKRDVALAREALSSLEQGAGLARTQEVVRRIDERLRSAWLSVVRLLSKDDAPGALAEGLRGLRLIPDHWALLADVCLLQLEAGDPLQALASYARLTGASPEHAQAIAEACARGVARIARTRLRERRAQEALDLLDRATTLFPQRADLLMARAEALVAVGRNDEAAAVAAGAAALDPSFAKEAASLQTLALRHRTPGVVQIPFDPSTNVVNAKVTVSGHALTLVVDTGATLTTIPSAIADDLNLRKAGNQKVKVNTASGSIEGEVVTLPSLRIGQIEVKNVQAVVLDLPDSLQGKGLLGLNVLQRLNMEIDSQNGVLVLKQGFEGRRR